MGNLGVNILKADSMMLQLSFLCSPLAPLKVFWKIMQPPIKANVQFA